MAYAKSQHVFTGSYDFDLSFVLGYISRAHVKAFRVADDTELSFDWLTDNSIRITDTLVDGESILIRRIVPKGTLVHDLTVPGSATRENLHATVLQSIMIMHEVLDGDNQDLQVGPFVGDVVTQGLQIIVDNYAAIVNLGAFTPADLTALGDFVSAINAAQVDATTALNLLNATNRVLANNQSLTFVGDNNGFISKLIQMKPAQNTDRPSVVWYDVLDVLRAAVSWHEINAPDNTDHSAFEIKTDDGNLGMNTRLSISSGEDQAVVTVNESNGFHMRNSGETVFETFPDQSPNFKVYPNSNVDCGYTLAGDRVSMTYNSTSGLGELSANTGKNWVFYVDGRSASDWTMFVDTEGVKVKDVVHIMSKSFNSLPDPTTVPGARASAINHNTPANWGDVVSAGAGTSVIPVWSDGTAWRFG